jgi:hypothetical protein
VSGKHIFIKPFSSENAHVRLTSISAGEIAAVISYELKKLIQKAGYVVTVEENGGISVEGDVILIDEGKRFLRYLFGPLGIGATKLEIEGTIRSNGGAVHDFRIKKRGLGGVGGGNSELLLENSARRAARKINKLIQQTAVSG